MCCSRELTLVEYVRELPPCHLARKQLNTLLARVEMTPEEAQLAYDDAPAAEVDIDGVLRAIDQQEKLT